MTTMPTKTRRALALALGALLIVRLAAAVLIAPPVVADGQGYTASARRLLDTGTYAYPMYGETFWERTAEGALVFRSTAQQAFNDAPPNAFTMPGYAVFLAGIWAVTGGADPWAAARIVQAVLSVLTAWMAWSIARRFGKRTAWVALALTATYPPFTLADSYIGTEALFLFLFTASVHSLLRWSDSRRAPAAAVAGLAIGLAFLVRPTGALWAIAVVVAIAAASRAAGAVAVRRACAQALAIACTAAIVISPWLVRNHALYGEFVTVGTSSGGNVIQGFWQDSHQRTPWPWDLDGVRYSDEDRAIAAITDEVYATGPTHETDDRPMLAYFGTASADLTRRLLAEYPAAVLSARASSTAASLVWPHAVSPAVAHGVPFTVSWVMHAGLLALSVAGLALLPRRMDAWIVASVPLYFVGVHALIFPLWRYYFPALACGAIIAALAADRLLTTLSRSAVDPPMTD